MKYTIEDAGHIIPVDQTPKVVALVEDYQNNGKIPAYDPCLSCEPNHARTLIGLIQTAERTGLWPPKREAAPKAKAKTKAKAEPVDLSEGGYIAGTMSEEQVAEQMAKRPEMFGTE